MPEIPQEIGQVPEYVPQAKASPELFSLPSATAAKGALEAQQSAEIGARLSYFLQIAQSHVTVKQGQIAIEKYVDDMHNQLSRQTTSEGVDNVYKQYDEGRKKILEPYLKDPLAATPLNLYDESQSVNVQKSVMAKKAQIITENDIAANKMIGEKSIQDYTVAVKGGGDRDIPIGEYQLALATSVRNGTMTEGQAAFAFQNWTIKAQEAAIGASVYSNNPADINRVINQLSSKDKTQGPFDISALNEEQRSQILRKAQESLRTLDNLTKSQTHDVAITTAMDEFNTPNSVYKGDYDAQLKRIDDPDFQRHIGLRKLDPNTGQEVADHEGIDKLRQEIRARATDTHEAGKKQAYKLIDDIVDQPSITKANQMLEQNKEFFKENAPELYWAAKQHIHSEVVEARTERRSENEEARQARYEAKLDAAEKSAAMYGQISSRITSGETVDPLKDIYGHVKPGELSWKDARELAEMNKQVPPGFKFGVDVINEAFNNKTIDAATRGKAVMDLKEAVEKEDLKGQAIIDKAKDIVHPQTQSWIGKQLDSIKGFVNRNAGASKPTTSALAVGTIQSGYRFKGGNPADKNNWEKIQ